MKTTILVLSKVLGVLYMHTLSRLAKEKHESIIWWPTVLRPGGPSPPFCPWAFHPSFRQGRISATTWSCSPNSPSKMKWRLYTCDLSFISTLWTPQRRREAVKLFVSHVLLRWDGHGHAYSPSPRHEILEGFSHISSSTEAMKTNPICSMISFADLSNQLL